MVQFVQVGVVVLPRQAGRPKIEFAYKGSPLAAVGGQWRLAVPHLSVVRIAGPGDAAMKGRKPSSAATTWLRMDTAGRLRLGLNSLPPHHKKRLG